MIDGIGESASPTPVRLHAIVVTYRRPDVVRATIQSVLDQTRPPDNVWVVDNDPTDELEQWTTSLPVDSTKYMAMSENVGPAGGIAAAMTELLLAASDDDYVVLIDDDDPPPWDSALEALIRLLESSDEDCGAAGSRIAGVGLVGAMFDRRRAIMRRVPDDCLHGLVDVDCIAGNQLPMYRVSSIRDVGVFDRTLFFGFEELEFCLRLRTAGWRLVVDGAVVHELRRRAGRLGGGPRIAAPVLQPWRRYYSTRNLVLIARRASGVGGTLAALGHAGLLAGARALVLHRRPDVAWMALRGALDGLLGRTGSIVEPRQG